MCQAHVLGQILVIQLERRRDRGVQDFDLVAQDFDFAAGNVGIVRPFGAAAHTTGHFQYEFVAHRFGDAEHLGAVRIAHHLRQSFAVAQVDENHPAVVAAAMCPAAQGDGLVEVGNVELPAIMSSHSDSVQSEKNKGKITNLVWAVG